MAEKRGIIKKISPKGIFIEETPPGTDLEAGKNRFFYPETDALFQSLQSKLQEYPQGIVVEYNLQPSRKPNLPNQACDLVFVEPAPAEVGMRLRKKGLSQLKTATLTKPPASLLKAELSRRRLGFVF